MAEKKNMLSEVVDVSTRFQRSVNLEKDYSPNPETNGYIVTPMARKALRNILDGLEGEGVCRSLTLTGPYGVGKSAFALFLSRLLCADHKTRDLYLRQIKKQEPGLAQALAECSAFEDSKKSFLSILITARRVPATQCILQGIADSVSSSGSRKLRVIGTRLKKYLEADEREFGMDSRKIVEELIAVCEAAREAGYSGTVLIIDELGKLFEYAARDSKKGDVYIIQEIAELASRSDDNTLVFIGLLHQGFDEYARHLDIVTRQEWTKIQGRFTDIAFQEPTEQVVRLIASAITLKDDLIPSFSEFRKKLRQLAKAAIKSGVKPPTMADAEFEDIACSCFPLHPTTLVALPILFSRFAQNERSLFSYLSSLEHGGFRYFLKTNVLDTERPQLIRLSHLFDYFTTNFGAGLYRQPHARRWLEASDALDRQEGLTDMHRQLVKTIGVLSVLGEVSHLRATESVLSNCLNDMQKLDEVTRSGIKDLQESSLIVYRRFNKTYRVWEGSDIDVEERIADGERKIRQTRLATIVQRYLVKRPMVARRHSFETGALRYFDLVYVDDPGDVAFPFEDRRRSDGQIVVCLAESSTDAQEFKKRALDAKNQKTTVFALPQDIGELRSAATELAALRWVWDNTPELRDDRVARREIALRITEAERLLHRTLNGLLDPRPQPVGSNCLWFYMGKARNLQNRAAVSHLLSTVCDEIYNQAAKIRNELVCRRSLSSAATAARRNLIEAMWTNSEKAVLGIEGFPPERSMYESFLVKTKIHSKGKGGTWQLQPPNKDRTHNLLPCWDYLCEMVFDRQPEPIPLDELFSELVAPPFGLIDGLHPLILCAFMKAYPDETTLYRDGSFIPEPAIPEFEVLMRRPELFALAGSRISGGRAKVVQRLAKGFHVKPATVPVVKALFRMVKGLPEFAWRTQQLPVSVLQLRDAFDKAKSPERFLFVEAPQALGIEPFSDDAPNSKHVESFFDELNENLQAWANIAVSTLDDARDSLLDACGYQGGEAGWQRLRADAVDVEPSITDPELLAFVRRVIQTNPDRQGIEAVLALVANRPPRSWSDSDVARFPKAAKRVGVTFTRTCRNVQGSKSAIARLEALNPQEREKVEQLLDQMRSSISRISNDSSSGVVNAAVSILASELKNGETDE
ncbi:MAG: hypothetical protein K9N52_04155 [Verrucomicrobia bacterium]|nr:hypothetical protein [Verrucomicrobiota bacterium]